jgi:hypothetical protein
MEIQLGSVASHVYCRRKGFLKYEEMCKYLVLYEEAVSHIGMTLQPLPSEFPYTVYEENLIKFFIIVLLFIFSH